MKCPRCGKGKLFSGLLSVADTCPACGLSLHEHDVGDGPAFFAIVTVGFAVTFLAGWVEYSYAPPFWLHALLWVPAIILLSLLVLRIAKAWLIASQYYHQGRKDKVQ